MSKFAVIFDLETVPDLEAVSRVHDLDPSDEEGARAKLGTGFPKLIFHRIVCIGALVAEYADGAWRVQALGAPHIGERPEATLIADFAACIERLRPQLVTYNGHGFDLPVLRYRAMLHRISASGLTARPYFKRYDEAGLDLCDVLASYDARGRIGLDALCRAMDLPGKPDGIVGSSVADFIAAGRLDDVAIYCRADVVATYRIFLAYERLRGMLTEDGYGASETDLISFTERSRNVGPSALAQTDS